ncbi:DUF1499 domain-containing protein [Yoonia sp. 208BN28-4]|uniref:DUF1499 domain-containing protein n=1 Tax=Yoonia sp. 208BN28-4 TaxID=3126505 RepID=UPI0030AA881C
MLTNILYAIVAIAVALMLYIRFVPANAEKWTSPDVALMPSGDTDGERSFIAVRRVESDDMLDRLTSVALATPRTQLLSDGSGQWTTFVTRTRIMGYPDYTSARVYDLGGQPHLQIYARARFGKLDMGVNKARVQDWLTRLDLLTPEG